MKYGATPVGDGVEFRVWAPRVKSMALKLDDGRTLPMAQAGEDFEIVVNGARAGHCYSLLLDDTRERPDPVSRFQPEGVHGPSQIEDPAAFAWSDGEWKSIDLAAFIIYELHVGTFTPSGTFEAIVEKLPYLKELGITAIELMPVAQFPGTRNWGYDGVNLYAPHFGYGGPTGLKRLVDACHRAGLAVVLDVVYNHLGPEGNYLADFGPYFTDHYRTPWGQAMNFDGPGSDAVRRFVIDNALYWLTEFHIDALRLDAIHSIFDFGALHVLSEMTALFHEQAERLGRRGWIIAESDLNDVRVIRPRSAGGLGLDAQWNDEFHHAVRSYLTGDRRSFLAGFGRLEDIRKAIVEGFVHDGIYSTFRGRRYGSSSISEPGYRFVVFIQNHDQVANTSQGARLSALVSLEEQKLAAALVLCSPFLPLLFMGEEFADDAPFLYFTSHTDPWLANAVTEGRRAEIAEFDGAREYFDPQDPGTFEKSKITWGLVDQKPHSGMLRLYRELIALRKRWPCLDNCRKDLVRVDVNEDARWLKMERSDPGGSKALLICNFADVPAGFVVEDEWKLLLQTSAAAYCGKASTPRDEVAAHAASLFVNTAP